MDKKKTNATASSGDGKNGEKKEENFLTKTAHSIRDKMQGLTGEVKDKTHNLKGTGDSKKTKTMKDRAKTETKSKPSSQPPVVGLKDSGEESDDEDDSPKASAGPTTSTTARNGNNTNTAKSAPPSSKTSAPTTKRESTNTLPGSKNRSSTSKLESKPSVEKTSSESDNHDHVHINLHGVSTVDNVLDRIDRAVEKAQIVIEKAEGPISVQIDTKPTAVPADLEKLPREKPTAAKTETDSQEQKSEPIRIDFNEIHELDDILSKVIDQPGDRPVILENAPVTPPAADVLKHANPFFSAPPPLSQLLPAASIDTDDGPPKSILKTSQDPSSLDTMTKVAAFQDDQVHVNIEGAQNVNDLPEETEAEQNEIPQTKTDLDLKKPLTPSASLPIQKREAPKAPHLLKVQDERKSSMPPIAISDFSSFALISTTTSAEELSNSENKTTPIIPPAEKKTDADEHNAWI